MIWSRGAKEGSNNTITITSMQREDIELMNWRPVSQNKQAASDSQHKPERRMMKHVHMDNFNFTTLSGAATLAM